MAEPSFGEGMRLEPRRAPSGSRTDRAASAASSPEQIGGRSRRRVDHRRQAPGAGPQARYAASKAPWGEKALKTLRSSSISSTL